jgi:tetratricopeptide (TPR) repeat protein
MVGLRGQLFCSIVATAVLSGATDSRDNLSAYRKLDEAQRARPQDAAATKAWLDEAARLATLAADHIEHRRYTEALKLLRATERPLAHAPSWNNLRGYAEFKADNPTKALHYLQRALQLDPQNEDYLLDIGEFLGHHRAHDEAVRVFEVAAKRMPQSPRVTVGLAVSYILQNRRDEAQRLLEALIGGHPRFEPAYKALGECYEDANNAKGLVELGRALQRVNSRNPLGWYLEGAGLMQDARADSTSLDGAMTALRTSLRLNSASVRARFLLAKALQDSSADDAAIAELKQVLKLDPDHERGHYLLARLYQKTGQSESARLEFEKHKNIKARDQNAQYRRLLISIRDEGEAERP